MLSPAHIAGGGFSKASCLSQANRYDEARAACSLEALQRDLACGMCARDGEAPCVRAKAGV